MERDLPPSEDPMTERTHSSSKPLDAFVIASDLVVGTHPVNIQITIAGLDPHDVTRETMARIQQKIDEELQRPELLEAAEKATPERQHNDWIAAVRDWSNSHPRTTRLVDDSREGIYEGRGL